MEHVYGHCCTSPRLREPSETFMDPQMDPQIYPARLILEDPCQSKALKGPSKVQIDQFLFIDLKTTDKLKNTAWFEVNCTFGCREIDLMWAICPPPPPVELLI